MDISVVRGFGVDVLHDPVYNKVTSGEAARDSLSPLNSRRGQQHS